MNIFGIGGKIPLDQNKTVEPRKNLERLVRYGENSV